jgi:phosphoenolpyruvate carboxykinase (GTP)
MGQSLPHPPAIFHVNWFRTDAQGHFLWPGFGQNVRVLKWILERVRGGGKAVDTPIGLVPSPDGLERAGLDLPASALAELLRIDRADWERELASQRQFFERFGARLPQQIWEEHEALARRLSRVSVPAGGVSEPAPQG